MSTKRSRETDEEQPQLESSELLSIVADIHQQQGSQKDKQRIFRKKYPEFSERYPVLFEMSTREDFDIRKFQYMIHMRDSVSKNNISQYDASAKVGTMLYNDYVKPLVDKK